MTDKEKEEIRQIVRQEFENLVKKNNKIVEEEIKRRDKKYGKGQGDFIKSYLIKEKPNSDEMYSLVSQLIRDGKLKWLHNKKETGEFYKQMQKYWAMIKRMQELGLDYTIPFRIIIPSRSAFYRAFGGKPRVEINEDINELEGRYEDIF